MLLRVYNNDFLRSAWSVIYNKKNFHYNSLWSRIRDDEITPHNSSWSAALGEREREREIQWEREREKNKTWNRKRRKIVIHREGNKDKNMMGLDPAISSFLASLVNKSYRKAEESKIKKGFNVVVKTSSKPFSVSKILSLYWSPRLEKFRWPVIVVKLRKGQKNLETIANLTKFC